MMFGCRHSGAPLRAAPDDDLTVIVTARAPEILRNCARADNLGAAS
jgi:hypothetical protein